MTNNDILRRVRYLFNFSENKIVGLFKLTNFDIQKTDVSAWLRKEEDPLLVEISDKELAIFLNGLIIERRGQREGDHPQPEESLSNNMILRKLKIALNLKSDEILQLFELVDRKLSKHELSAFFRKPNHKSYRNCMDQYLRNFLTALQLKYKNSLATQSTDNTNS